MESETNDGDHLQEVSRIVRRQVQLGNIILGPCLYVWQQLYFEFHFLSGRELARRLPIDQSANKVV